MPRSMLEMRTESIDQNISNNIGQEERGENFPTHVSMVVAYKNVLEKVYFHLYTISEII